MGGDNLGQKFLFIQDNSWNFPRFPSTHKRGRRRGGERVTERERRERRRRRIKKEEEEQEKEEEEGRKRDGEKNWGAEKRGEEGTLTIMPEDVVLERHGTVGQQYTTFQWEGDFLTEI